MGGWYIDDGFDTDGQRTKECRARRYRSFARPTSEYFQGYFLCKNSGYLMVGSYIIF